MLTDEQVLSLERYIRDTILKYQRRRQGQSQHTWELYTAKIVTLETVLNAIDKFEV